ncbi:putative short-chain dehydrogenase [Paratrimastix pyriformis]|uniref:Short-chain dehydrogenase n=1 Tax=Paratrimastix pyriformis TaxID=342808 RepID=A0ABQ8UQR6_9EUKA|nr:putative short-chain dehydrogenase [Paratrimastix pyriformis]
MLLECCGVLFLVSVLTYAIPHLLTFLGREQDLYKKYAAGCTDRPWAVVTGASSGIGLEFATKAASQGFNICAIAYPDAHMETVKSMATTKKVHFRCLPIDLAGVPQAELEDKVKKMTEDIDVALLFMCAGITLFQDCAVGAENSLRLLYTNVLANMHIFFVLYPRIVSRPLLGGRSRRGGVVMIGSMSSFFPVPFTTMYGASKAFLTSFGSALGPEAALSGVDVMVINPGPVKTRLFSNTYPLSSLRLSGHMAQTTVQITRLVWKTLGRACMYSRDAGMCSWGLRLLIKCVDPYALGLLWAYTTRFLGDYKNFILGKKPFVLRHCAPGA